MTEHTTPPLPPEQVLMQMATGKWVSKALSVIADLAVPDLLRDGPLSADEMGTKIGVSADALYRLLRAASAVGVFTELPGRRFQNNEMSSLMLTGVPGSLRAMVRWIGEDSAWQAWGSLGYSVQTAKPAFDKVIGLPVFEHFRRHPETGKIFNDAMSNFSSITAAAVAAGYDFSPFKQIVDVGGGHGALLSAIADRFPGVRGVIADLPEVVAGAPPLVASRGHAARITTAATDFFASVPAGADAYIMKHIIHDWDDERSAKILSNCRKAMAAGGKVLIIDQVVSDRPEAVFSKIVDLEMLVMTPGGRERTAEEFGQLLKASGLALTRIVPTQSIVAVVEAIAA